jgi:uncharacterized membrane protein
MTHVGSCFCGTVELAVTNKNRTDQMSASETSSQVTRSAPSRRAAVLMAAVIIVFGILHIAAGVLLHNALRAPPTEPSRLVTYGD